MAQHPWLDSKPFHFRGGSVGCRLIHGFTGSPPEMRPLGRYLAKQGLTISGPLLARHGTDYRDLAKTTWRDWYASAEEALVRLQSECPQVLIDGPSLGSLLTLCLAAQHPTIAGAVLYSPALAARERRMKFLRPLRHSLHNSGHCLTGDGEREYVWQTTPEWIAARSERANAPHGSALAGTL